MYGYGLIYTILIGLCAGWLAGQITKGKGLGILGNLIVGIIGALLGAFVFGLLGLAPTSLLGSLITATCGAILLLWLLRKIRP